jgi:hypothetical protein
VKVLVAAEKSRPLQLVLATSTPHDPMRGIQHERRQEAARDTAPEAVAFARDACAPRLVSMPPPVAPGPARKILLP